MSLPSVAEPGNYNHEFNYIKRRDISYDISFSVYVKLYKIYWVDDVIQSKQKTPPPDRM